MRVNFLHFRNTLYASIFEWFLTNSIISFLIAQGIRRNNPTTITESYSADQVFARPTTANWIKYGFASQEDYDHEVETIYCELLEDEVLDSDDLSDEDSNYWMNEAEARLLHRLKMANKKPKEEKLKLPKGNRFSRMSREQQVENLEYYTCQVRVFKN